MGRDSRDDRARYRRIAAVLCLSVAAWCLAGATRALTRAELYQASVPIADRSEAAKPAAFEAALRVVLVRVTGRRGVESEPAFASLLGNARRYVQQYRETQDGKLWVSFDAAAIDRWLGENNQPLWGRERPATFIWLTVPGGASAGTIVTAEDGSEIKAAIDAAAYERGAPVIWPSAADLQRNHLDYAAVGAASFGVLADLAHRAGGAGTLVGRSNGPGASSAVRWTYQFRDRSSEFSGSAAEGVQRAADTYASLFGVSGAAAPIVIEVAGIGDLKDYAFVQNYLESLAFISHVAVETLSGDAARFRVTTRGGAEALQNALILSGRLRADGDAETGVARFQLQR